jgi:hypothetical protein
MTLLVRHPSTPAGAVHTVDADLERVAGGVVATFRVSGDLSRLVLPEPAAAGRADDLWKTTCFELFVEGEGATYREFNFSPSTHWAAYEFADYRQPSGNAEAQVEITCSSDPRQLILTANLSSEVPNPARVGLSAVIEETDGVLRYWAAAFAPGKPDFHARATRALLLDGVDAQ